MIEDLELRNLFRAESEEHLQTLENGLLRLEADPSDTSVLEDLFRSAHSLKGAARMLGVADLETLAHHFEDELGAARRGRQVMTSEGADRLYHGLDTMSRLVHEACDGEAAHIDMGLVLARLRGEGTDNLSPDSPGSGTPDLVVRRARASDVAADPVPITDIETSQVEANTGIAVEPGGLNIIDPSESEGPAPTSETSADANPHLFKIETIRVEPPKLDALMTLAGEMSVTTARVARSLTAISELAEIWEEWNREPATSLSPKGTARMKRMGEALGRMERSGDEEIGRLGTVVGELIDAIRDIRLLPLSTIFSLFPRLVRDLGHEQGKEVRLEIEGGSITADKHLLEEIKDPLMHMIRNAVDHAIELPDERERQGKPREATIRLRASRSTTRMTIEISDDGRGLDEEAIGRSAVQRRLMSASELTVLTREEVQRLIFLPGFTTAPLITDVSGRGVGLDVVRTNIERLKGTIDVESVPGAGCIFRIHAPISLVTTRVLLVQIAQKSYAIPIDSVQETFLVSPQAIFSVEGHPTIQWERRPVRVAPLADLLEISNPLARLGPSTEGTSENTIPGILLGTGSEKIGLLVDALLDEQEVIVKPFRGLLHRVRNVLGSTILSTGEICMVLSPQDLAKSMRRRTVSVELEVNPTVARKKLILLAEDSITTRTQEKRILEAAGYEVVTAVDGAEAFAKLGSQAFDAVVSDIEMPNMTGLQLAARIREDSKYNELPIILVTSLATDDDRQRGIEIGANAYITKGTFDQKVLIDTLRKLV